MKDYILLPGRTIEDEKSMTRSELVALLCLSSAGLKHSRLKENLPSRGRDTQVDVYIDDILPSLAVACDADGGSVYRPTGDLNFESVFHK